MKNIPFSLRLMLFICFISANISAQDAEFPIPIAKGIDFKNEHIPTVIPPDSEPPRALPEGEFTENRKVFWVHGHGGNVGSWDRAAAATQNAQIPPLVNPADPSSPNNYYPRKVISHKIDYSGSHNAVSSAGSDIKTQIEAISAIQTPTEKQQNIVIAHSLGGLVSEYADYLYDNESDENRSFYGLVTVGTPNLGAILSANAYPYSGSKASQFADEACKALTAGPIAGKIADKFALQLLSNFVNVEKLTSEFCDFLTDDVATLLLKGFSTPIAADLNPNSQVVGLLSNHMPEVTRRVAFYGVVDNQDLIWKTYHYLKNGPNTEPSFAADNTQVTIDKMNNNKSKYQSNVDAWDNKVDDLTIAIGACWWFPPSCLVLIAQRNKAIHVRNAYQKGLDWWNSANDKWRNLMGDITLVASPQGSCKCTDYNVVTGQTSGPNSTFGLLGNCTANHFAYPISQTCEWVTTYTLQDVASDGIVQESTAIALPGAVASYKFDGDTHFQMVNSPRLKDALNQLWDGKLHLFFKTDKK